ASLDQRYAGCVAFGAMFWDMAGWIERIEAEMKSGSTATSHFQVPWVLGVPGLEMGPAIDIMRKFTLEGIVGRMTCPFLVVHGENDRLIPPEEAQRLYDEVGSPDKEIRIFTIEEGSAEHCQVDDRRAGVNHIADWIEEHVVAR